MISYKRDNYCDASKWHRYFVWYPTQVDTTPDGHIVVAFFETVMRCGDRPNTLDGGYWTWKYKPLVGDSW